MKTNVKRSMAVAVAMGVVASGFGASSAANADTIENSASVALSTVASTATLKLDQFDSKGGDLILKKATVTAAVSGSIDGNVKNLSPRVTKDYVSNVSASISVDGPGVTDLTAKADNTSTHKVAPLITAPVSLSASDSSQKAITDPDVLAKLVGSGTVNYAVTGNVFSRIQGPGPYVSQGTTAGNASVKVAYDYTDCTTLTDVNWDYIQWQKDDAAHVESVWGNKAGGIYIVIPSLHFAPSHAWPEGFDFTAPAKKVYRITVSGHNGSKTYDFPGGVTSGTDIRPNPDAPEGDDSGVPRVKRIQVCFGD